MHRGRMDWARHPPITRSTELFEESLKLFAKLEIFLQRRSPDPTPSPCGRGWWQEAGMWACRPANSPQSTRLRARLS